MADRDLLAALVKRASGHRDRVPVFRLAQPSPAQAVKDARAVALRIWDWFGDCRIRPVVAGSLTAMLLPDNGRVDVFHPSGAIAASMRRPSARVPLASDERNAGRKALVARTQQLATTIARDHVAHEDVLQFESLWETKAQGVTLRGEKTAIALLEVVGAFRRYLHGLPVLGRASVHVGLGAGGEVTKWGIDWRRVESKPFTHATVIDPEKGAADVLDELAWRRPERPFTLDDFEPASFTLGYFSASRRSEQYVMQPVWVAVLRPRGGTTIGQVVAVPAAPHTFEPILRPGRMRRSSMQMG